jgi:hypothetical protein
MRPFYPAAAAASNHHVCGESCVQMQGSAGTEAKLLRRMTCRTKGWNISGETCLVFKQAALQEPPCSSRNAKNWVVTCGSSDVLDAHNTLWRVFIQLAGVGPQELLLQKSITCNHQNFISHASK